MTLGDLIASLFRRRVPTSPADALAELVPPSPNSDLPPPEHLPASHVSRPAHLDIALQILYRTADGQPSRHAVIVHRPIFTIGAGSPLLLYGFTAFCMTRQSEQIFCRDRIVEACHAPTGEVIDDLEAWLKTRA